MDCKNKTKKELMDLFASDWGYPQSVTEKFSHEELIRACESSSPHLYLKNLIYFIMKGLIQVEENN